MKDTRLRELEKLETDIRYEIDNLDFSNEDKMDDSYFYMKSIIDTLQGVSDDEKEDLLHALNFNEDDYEEALYDVLLAIEVIKGGAE